MPSYGLFDEDSCAYKRKRTHVVLRNYLFFGNMHQLNAACGYRCWMQKKECAYILPKNNDLSVYTSNRIAYLVLNYHLHRWSWPPLVNQ